VIYFLTTGIILGLSAGIAPGPLLALIISETLRHDIKTGIKVAIAPIITDIPIIILTLLISASLSEFSSILGVVSLFGGFFVLYLGIESIRSKGTKIDITTTPSKALQKGILTNLLSPHPYLFWFTVGAPIITKAMQKDIFCVAAFLTAFYSLLVGSKIVLAVITGTSRSFLTGRAYILIMRVLGTILCIFAGLLIIDGLKMMGWI
jgi:threonine/homoserine/homoserine lactone efflux protein